MKKETVLLLISVLLFLGAMWIRSKKCEPLWQEQVGKAQPSPPFQARAQVEKEEKVPLQKIPVELKVGDKLLKFEVERAERDSDLVHYDQKTFHQNMIFDCEDKEMIAVFTHCAFCSNSFRNCEKTTLIIYGSDIYIPWQGFDSEALFDNFHIHNNLRILNSHFQDRECVIDETKEYVVPHHRQNNDEIFVIQPEPKGEDQGKPKGKIIMKEKPWVLVERDLQQADNDDGYCKTNDQGETECFYPFANVQQLEYSKYNHFYQVLEMNKERWSSLFEEEPSKEKKAIPLGPDEELCKGIYGNGCKRNKKTGEFTLLHPKDGRWFEDDLEFVKPEEDK